MRKILEKWRHQRAERAAEAAGVTEFEKAEADELAEAAKRAVHAAAAALDEYKSVGRQADEYGRAAAGYEEKAYTAAAEYNTAIDEGVDERKKVAMWKAVVDAWEAAAAAGRKEADECDAAAAAVWKLAAAAATYLHTAEIAVKRADESKAGTTGVEQKAWAGRARIAREWEKDARKFSKERLEYALAQVPLVYRSAARAHAWAAGAKAVADTIRDMEDQVIGRQEQPGDQTVAGGAVR